MVLLEKTQELKKSDWETLYSDAISRSGPELYVQKLDEVGNLMDPILQLLSPSIGPQNVLLAALKAEEMGGSQDLEDQIPEIIQSLRSGDPDLMKSLLKKFVPHSDEARKMQRVGYKEYQRLKEDRNLVDQLTGGTHVQMYQKINSIVSFRTLRMAPRFGLLFART
jgi:hypothetical protein